MSKPLEEMRAGDPCTVVIFGASGDLTQRKLIPALWHLFLEKRLPAQFRILGVARSAPHRTGFGSEALAALPGRTGHAEEWAHFVSRLEYLQRPYDEPQSYLDLRARIEALGEQDGAPYNVLLYLSTPPSGYEEIISQLGGAGFAALPNGRWSRIIVEKPFGTDLTSSIALNQALRGVFEEQQIYRIDHYLGKETVQNLLVFRFANGIFEPIWNRQYVDHVQISVAEALGVEDRAVYYEKSGALRDMVQNHLMQVLCMVAMEAPASLEQRAVRNEKSKVLEAIRPIAEAEVPKWAVRGQYAAATVGGESLRGYLQEKGVEPDSRTETYAAVKFRIENWRWAGVPFYLRSGKRMQRRVTEVSIFFRRAPHLLFRSAGAEAPDRNVLTIRIQPDEAIDLSFGVKQPGAGMIIRPTTMRFDYQEHFHTDPPEAYERLLLDCMRGDITLFSREDWMNLSWKIMDPILSYWSGSPDLLPQYRSGGWGPAEADELLKADEKRGWANPS
jgi:glucose-6-phosphate 1-dehydrogenase